MVKLEDGSLVYAGQLLSGECQDDDGKALKFKVNDGDQTVPFYRAEVPMRDGSGRKKIYSFDLGTTQVRVSVSTVEEEKDKSKKEKEGEENSGDEEVTATKKSAESEGLRATTEAKIVKTTPTGKPNTR